jgi:hypothetical protein
MHVPLNAQVTDRDVCSPQGMQQCSFVPAVNVGMVMAITHACMQGASPDARKWVSGLTRNFRHETLDRGWMRILIL